MPVSRNEMAESGGQKSGAKKAASPSGTHTEIYLEGITSTGSSE